MNKLMMRKLILAGAVVLLALIYIIQVIAGNRSSVKDFVIEKSFDTIEIASSDKGAVTLKRYGDFWKIGMNDTDTNNVAPIVEAVKNIRTLSVVSTSSSDDAIERYGFSDAQKITVRVSDNGKEYLALEIGKDAANGQQNYVRLNGKSDIYLATNALKSKFSVTESDLIKAPEPAPAQEAAPEASESSGAASEESPNLL